jgi:hypothetical protein
MCNDNSRSAVHRKIFVEKNGGSFIRKGPFWEWINQDQKTGTFIIIKDPQIEKIEIPKKWIFADEEGKHYHVDNLTDFCKQFSLSRQKMYDLEKGIRKSHKGFKFIAKTGNPE